MSLPPANYPGSAWDGNEQDISEDVPGTDIANAADYNEEAAELKAHGDDLRAAFGKVSGASSLADALEELAAASPADLTDSKLWIPAGAFAATSGTWTRPQLNSLWVLERDPDTGINGITAPLGVMGRSTASLGLRVDSMDWVYHVATAAVDDVTFGLTRFVVPADTAAPSGVTTALGTYHDDYNTAVERAALGYHTAEVTFGEFVADFGWDLFFAVDGDAGPAGVVSVFGALVSLTDIPRA